MIKLELKWDIWYIFTGRKLVGGSNVGGLKETQGMLDFAAKHSITANVEVIPVDYMSTAMECFLKSNCTN